MFQENLNQEDFKTQGIQLHIVSKEYQFVEVLWNSGILTPYLLPIFTPCCKDYFEK